MTGIFSVEGFALMAVIGGLAYWSERRLIAKSNTTQPRPQPSSSWAQGMQQDQPPIDLAKRLSKSDAICGLILCAVVILVSLPLAVPGIVFFYYLYKAVLFGL